MKTGHSESRAISLRTDTGHASLNLPVNSSISTDRARVEKESMLPEKVTSERAVKADEDVRKTKAKLRWRQRKTLAALRSYLKSSIFREVGPITAKEIVAVFGLRTPQVIETSPHELLTVKGVGKTRMSAVKNGWAIQPYVISESAELIKLIAEINSQSFEKRKR